MVQTRQPSPTPGTPTQPSPAPEPLRSTKPVPKKTDPLTGLEVVDVEKRREILSQIDQDAYVGVEKSYMFDTPPDPASPGMRQGPEVPVPRPPIYTERNITLWYGAAYGQVMELQAKLQNHGLLEPGSFMPGVFDPKTEDAYRKLVTAANMKGTTTDDILLTMEAGFDVFGWPGEEGPSELPENQIRNSVNLTSRGAALSLLQQTMAAELGRDPSDEEVSDFITALTKEQQAAPAVTTVTYSRGPKGEVVSNEVNTPSAVSPEMEAQGYAENVAPGEREAFQEDSFMDVILNMIKVPGR